MSLSVVMLACVAIAAQDLQKLVDTEHAFATLAEAKGTKHAFLTFTAPDGVLFLPDKIGVRDYWNARGESTGLLSWAPNFADISSTGQMGYTTGNWEYRPKGKTDAPVAFGEFVTIWMRQSDGEFRYSIDIGIGHERPARYSTEWLTADKRVPGKKAPEFEGYVQAFTSAVRAGSISKAYKRSAADDVRGFREDKQPFVGKKALLAGLASEKGTVVMGKRGTLFRSGDLAYSLNTYTRQVDGKAVENGNALQIWRLNNGKWEIVLDIVKPVPPPKPTASQ